jgi:hypothetical protein
MPVQSNILATHHQFKRHKLDWTFGDYHFIEAINDIILKVKCDKVYGKGSEKVKFLKTWLPQIEDMTWIKISSKNLFNCASEVCGLGHGLNCARRKVHELRFIDWMYNKVATSYILDDY